MFEGLSVRTVMVRQFPLKHHTFPGFQRADINFIQFSYMFIFYQKVLLSSNEVHSKANTISWNGTDSVGCRSNSAITQCYISLYGY